jgi:hypothetical protein
MSSSVRSPPDRSKGTDIADQRLLVAERALADAWVAVDRAFTLIRDLKARPSNDPSSPVPILPVPDSVRSSLPTDFTAPWYHGRPPVEVK